MALQDLIRDNPSLDFSYDYEENLGAYRLGVKRGRVSCEIVLKKRDLQSEDHICDSYKALIYDLDHVDL